MKQVVFPFGTAWSSTKYLEKHKSQLLIAHAEEHRELERASNIAAMATANAHFADCVRISEELNFLAKQVRDSSTAAALAKFRGEFKDLLFQLVSIYRCQAE